MQDGAGSSPLSGQGASPLTRTQAAKTPGSARLRVCVVGGGGTGAALAYDLALRGVQVVLLERGELTSGTTGRHHGQLHCGARYAAADRTIARECYEESLILRRIVPQAVEYNGGLFVALSDEEADWTPTFMAALAESGIPASRLTAQRALELEPALNPLIRLAVRVPDGTFDAFRVPLSFFAAARALGADIRPWCEVVGFERSGGRVVAAQVVDRRNGSPVEESVRADYFVNAAGAWAGSVGLLAGVDIPVTPAPGALLAVRCRICDHVVSRLRPPADGDIMVPQRGLSIIGSTQRDGPVSEAIRPLPEEIEFLRHSGAQMFPAYADAPLHAAWAAARPLSGRATGDSRLLSRDFTVIDHSLTEGLGGFCSLIGGKATVLRAMAEKAADMVCSAFGLKTVCRSADFVLPSWRDFYRGERQ